VPYSYQEKIEVDGITIEYVNREYLASAPLSPDQQTRLIEMIKKANEDQERAWDVNQPLDPKPETSK
jgi:hypothetical protein